MIIWETLKKWNGVIGEKYFGGKQFPYIESALIVLVILAVIL